MFAVEGHDGCQLAVTAGQPSVFAGIRQHGWVSQCPLYQAELGSQFLQSLAYHGGHNPNTKGTVDTGIINAV